VGFEAGFASSKNALEVIASDDEVLTRQGWTHVGLGRREGPGRMSTWTKRIPPAVDIVELSLYNKARLGGRTPNNEPRLGWALSTSAKPPGYPVRGC
jgi:hypothetical protein